MFVVTVAVTVAVEAAGEEEGAHLLECRRRRRRRCRHPSRHLRFRGPRKSISLAVSCFSSDDFETKS